MSVHQKSAVTQYLEEMGVGEDGLTGKNLEEAVGYVKNAPGAFRDKLLQTTMDSKYIKGLVFLTYVPELREDFSLVVPGYNIAEDDVMVKLCMDPEREFGCNLEGKTEGGYVGDEDWESLVVWPEIDVESEHPDCISDWDLAASKYTLTCVLRCSANGLIDKEINIPSSCCLILMPSQRKLVLEKVVFKGGAVACMGHDCKAQFLDSTFDTCTFIALDGARVEMNGTCTRMPYPLSGKSAIGNATDLPVHSLACVGMFAMGALTRVTMRNCKMGGGGQGMSVQGGAKVYAAGLEIKSISKVCIEARGAQSFVEMKDFHLGRAPVSGVDWPDWENIGICAYDKATIRLKDGEVRDMSHGVIVVQKAMACFKKIKLFNNVERHVSVVGGCVAVLEGCEINGGEWGIRTIQSRLSMIGCVVGGVVNSGVLAEANSKLKVEDSKILYCGGGVKGVGGDDAGLVSSVVMKGTNVEFCLRGIEVDRCDADLTTVASNRNGHTEDGLSSGLCLIGERGRLQAKECCFNDNTGSGVVIYDAGRAEMTECEFRNNGECGVCNVDGMVKIADCRFYGNGYTATRVGVDGTVSEISNELGQHGE